jgi:hypothetical protein
MPDAPPAPSQNYRCIVVYLRDGTERSYRGSFPGRNSNEAIRNAERFVITYMRPSAITIATLEPVSTL